MGSPLQHARFLLKSWAETLTNLAILYFIDIEVIGLDVKDIPVDYKKLVADYTGKENAYKKDGTTIKSIPQEFGSSGGVPINS